MSQRETVAKAAPEPGTVSLGVVGIAAGGAAGGALLIAAMVYVGCQCKKKRKQGATKTPNGEGETNHSKVDTTMNASKIGLFDGKNDTELGSKSPIGKSKA